MSVEIIINTGLVDSKKIKAIVWLFVVFFLDKSKNEYGVKNFSETKERDNSFGAILLQHKL